MITGRITDEFGDPITDVQVQALRFQSVNGERQLVTAGRTARTDDLGQYRIFGLMPGEYVVHASLREMPPGVREGSVEPTGYPGTFFPGVADASQAQTVSVTIGQELSAIGFPLVPASSHASPESFCLDGRRLGCHLGDPPAHDGSGLANLLGAQAGVFPMQRDASRWREFHPANMCSKRSSVPIVRKREQRAGAAGICVCAPYRVRRH